jgi:hypothetical protein
MSGRHADATRIVFDPAIPRRELRALRAADAVRAAVTAPLQHIGHRADRVLVAYLSAAGAAAAVQVAMPGVSFAWAWFLGIAAALAVVTGAAAHRIALGLRGRYVNPARMDPVSRQALARAQAAIGGVLGARVVRDGLLDALAAAAVLDAREWEIARMLGEACRLAAARARIADGAPAALAGPQRAALRKVRAAALEQVRDLEDCASQVRAADDAYQAHALASLDRGFLDLLAATAVGPYARTEVGCLRAEAAAAEQLYRAS